MAPDRDDSVISIEIPRWDRGKGLHVTGARYITIRHLLDVGEQRQSWPTRHDPRLNVTRNVGKDARVMDRYVATFPSFDDNERLSHVLVSSSACLG